MGIFNFMASAGKRLLGKGKEPAEAIKEEVKGLGLEGEVDVEVGGDTVRVKGKTPSQEMLEKIVLASGNVEGIAKVETEVETEDDVPEARFDTGMNVGIAIRF